MSDQGAERVDYFPKGKGTCIALGGKLTPFQPTGVALDGNDNLFVVNIGYGTENEYYAVDEFLAAGGYTVVNPLAQGFPADEQNIPVGIALEPVQPAPAVKPARRPSTGPLR